MQKAKKLKTEGKSYQSKESFSKHVSTYSDIEDNEWNAEELVKNTRILGKILVMKSSNIIVNT